MNASSLWSALVWPLCRLILFLSMGLFVAYLIESLQWTRALSKVARPLARMARLKDVAGASFALAFFSTMAANAMLAEHYDRGEISRRELLLSSLFNSLPVYFLHLPNLLFVAVPLLGPPALVYVGLTMLAASCRTATIVLLGRMLLPPSAQDSGPGRAPVESPGPTLQSALSRCLHRFRRRIKRLLGYTIPIYVLMYLAHQQGVFAALEQWLSHRAALLNFLPPQAMSIIVFQMAAEFTAGLAAAGAILDSGGLGARDAVLALLVGNILSTPVRAFRHQLPSYAGIFRFRMALGILSCNQTLRAASLIIVGVAYAVLSG